MKAIQPITVELARDMVWHLVSENCEDTELLEFINNCKRIANILIDYAEENILKDLPSYEEKDE